MNTDSSPVEQTEAEFLENYNPKDFAAILVTVDPVLFTYHDDQLKVLLVERNEYPDKGKWGLPGGFITIKENNKSDDKNEKSSNENQYDTCLEDAVRRKIKDKTGVIPPYLEQVEARGSAQRDKRGWSVTVVYTALIGHKKCQKHIDSVKTAEWVNYDDLSDKAMAFDHEDIIHTAREYLRQKALTSLVPACALPDEFTLLELQRVHEVLIGEPIHRKSFHRRILGDNKTNTSWLEECETPDGTTDKKYKKKYKMKPGFEGKTFDRKLGPARENNA